MLGVDGDELPLIGCIQHQLTAGDEALLIRQRETSLGAQGGQRRLEPLGANQSVQDHVRALQLVAELLHQVASRVLATDAVAAKLSFDEIGGAVGGYRDSLCGQTNLLGLLQQQLGLAAVGRNPNHLELFGIVENHLEGLDSDGSSAPENHHASLIESHGHILTRPPPPLLHPSRGCMARGDTYIL